MIDTAPPAPEISPARLSRKRLVWRWARRFLALVVAGFAAMTVSFFSVDLGRFPQVKRAAEEQASRYLGRPMHIGRLSALVTPGSFRLDDVVIEGRNPGDRPFLRAGHIYAHVPWWTIFRRELVIEIRLTDWRMVVERWADGHSMPRLVPRRTPGGPQRFTTTMRLVYAQNGEFVYDDHEVPWSVVARNLSFDMVRSTALQQYIGHARFSGGTVQIQQYQSMQADMSMRFLMDGSLVTLQHIDLTTDGTQSHINGAIDFSRWPEQVYNLNSTIDFSRMKDIFFQRENWRLGGQGHFAGVFQFFKSGRELVGDFDSAEAHVNGLAFQDLHGSLVWTQDRFAVTHAESTILGGRTRFSYLMSPLGTRAGATAAFSAAYDDLDLTTLDRLVDLKGLRFDGRATGSLSLQWPNGRFAAARQGQGETIITPTSGLSLAPSVLPAVPREIEAEPAPFEPYRAGGPIAIGGAVRYTIDPSGFTFDDSWAATKATYVRFHGRLASSSAPSSFPFQVTSHDWQESDRLLAAIMTATSGQTRAVEVGGRGTFEGVMTGSFSSPRIAGSFAGESMRVWDVTWGRARGDIVIENGYVDIADSYITGLPDTSIVTKGRFALGYRKDGAEEIHATVDMANWPLADLRHAFELDDWPVEGVMTLSGLALQGKYREMFGGGEMQIDRGTAWGEGFDRTTGSLLLEGSGLRVNRIEMTKGDGLIRGAARLGWDGTYAFNADGRVAVEALDNFRVENTPLSGMLSFRATGAAEFDSPTYTVAGVVPDLYIGDQGIGAIEGQIRINNGRLLIERMAVRSGLMDVDARGTVDLNDALDGDLHFRFTETSVDPYLKFVLPELSPYTRAILSGSVDVAGPLRQPRRLDIQGDVHDATLVLFDYQLKNDGPIQLSYANEAMAIRNLKLRGSDTNLAVTGGFDGRQRRWDLAAGGDASLAILQLFFPAINASGAATLDARLAGSFDQPVISGNATIADGRLRPLASPHSLEGINGRISFGAREINVDDLSGRIGSGLVDFGGTINLDGYRLAEYNLTASGRSMRLRYPQGFNSTVNMDLLLTGPIATPILTGSIDVLRVGLVAQAQTETGLLGLVAGGASATDLAPAEPVSGEGIPLALDIQVSVPRTAFIDTRTAHVEGTADLRVRGTFDRPVLTGALELVSGEWLFNGNRYFVREGTIDFGSSGSLEPVFDVAAETRPRAAGQTFDVQIRITGPLDRLSPTLTSDPWLPETEIISLLLGGTPSLRTVEQRALRSPQELQERMVQTAGAVLLTSPISSRVGAVVERFSTIDTVQITPLLSQDASFQQLNPSARITLGKRISSRLFLTYSRTLSASQEEIILIEYDQSDRMSWVLSRNQDRTFALDFRIRYVF